MRTKRLDRLWSATTAETISEISFQAVQNYLEETFVLRLPEYFDRAWVSTDRDNPGRFSVRVGRYLHAEHNVRLSAAHKSTIGQLAKADSATGLYDLSHTCSWQDGDFADSGSCYWAQNGASYHKGRHGLAEHPHAGAIRAWRDRTDGTARGCGRAWFVALSENEVVLFNAYGLSLARFSAAMSAALGWPHVVKVPADWRGCYVNHAVCMVVSATPTHRKRVDIDAHVKLSNNCDEYCDDTRSTCENCNERVDDDDTYGVDGSVYCESCYGELFAGCDRCGESIPVDDVVSIGDRYLCEYCAKKIASRCDACGDWTLDGFTTETHDGETLCETCVENECVFCENCNDCYRQEDDGRPDDTGLCVDCRPEQPVCSFCQEPVAEPVRVPISATVSDTACAPCARSYARVHPY